jgi:uncharacterized protein
MWKKLNGESIGDNLLQKVEETILYERSQGHRLKICIGSDSVQKNEKIEYATVIVFLREGKGGFMFIQKELQIQRIGLKERMINEVSKSVATAYELCPILEKYNVELEVHADINTDPNFKSNVALKEAMGYILGMGYQFKAKPHAFASSCCADKAI